MQLTPIPPNIALNMASAPEPRPEPFVVVAADTPDPAHNTIVQDEVVLAPDSDDGFECDANEWVVSPPHPSEFSRPPPIRPIFYVITIGEEAGIYDSTWAESFDIRRVSRLEQFAMRTFRDWDEAHRHYTHEYNLNHVANASRDSQRPPSPVTNPAVRMARAQSAPPSMASVGTRSRDRLQTATQPASQLQYGTLSQCGSPGRPIYVPSTWPTPALVRHVSSQAVTAQPVIAQPVIAQPVIAQPVVTQPTRLGYVCGLLPAILEQTDRPTGRRPMTQLHFDNLGRLVHPAGASISVPSSPEEVELPTVRKPQPFPFIPDPDFFTYPNLQPQQDPATTPVRPLSFPPSESGEAIPATPFLGTPSQQRRLVNLSPHIQNSSASTREITAVHDDPEADSEDIAAVATTLFVNGVTPESSASTAAKRGPPVASSSKTVRAARKRDSPSTPTSKTIKPTKVRKTTSTKKSRRAPEEDPEEEGKYASLWADE